MQGPRNEEALDQDIIERRYGRIDDTQGHLRRRDFDIHGTESRMR